MSTDWIDENWQHIAGDLPRCPHYLGLGDWSLDCDLMHWLCDGPKAKQCPLRNDDVADQKVQHKHLPSSMGSRHTSAQADK